ncbi:Zinc finger, CCHC-type superfamily [Sesbania bispinosa]|nr:Zinc finger, CCHC-type superfamily [Sesbania bispinosa]
MKNLWQFLWQTLWRKVQREGRSQWPKVDLLRGGKSYQRSHTRYLCGVCHQGGHNSRKCPNRPVTEDSTEQPDGQAAPTSEQQTAPTTEQQTAPTTEQQSGPTSEQQGQQHEANTAQGAPPKTNPKNRKGKGKVPPTTQEKGKAPAATQQKGNVPTAAQQKGKAPAAAQQKRKAPTIAQEKRNASAATQEKMKAPAAAPNNGKQPTASQTSLQTSSQASVVTLTPQEALQQLINAHKTSTYILNTTSGGLPQYVLEQNKFVSDLLKKTLSLDPAISRDQTTGGSNDQINSAAEDDHANIFKGLGTSPKHM